MTITEAHNACLDRLQELLDMVDRGELTNPEAAKSLAEFHRKILTERGWQLSQEITEELESYTLTAIESNLPAWQRQTRHRT